MFVLTPFLPALLGAATLGGLLGLFDKGGPDLSDVLNEVAAQPQLKPNLPPFPQGAFNAGGGSFSQDFDRIVDFTKTPKFLEGLRSGKKGKKLSSEDIQTILDDPSNVLLSEINLGPKRLAQLRKKGGISKPFPTFDVQSNPQSSELFDLGQQINLLNAANQLGINQLLASNVVPQQIGFLGNAINAANTAIPNLFEISPIVQDSINKAAEDFFTSGVEDITDAFNRITDIQDADLIGSGLAFSSDAVDLRGNRNQDLGKALTDLKLQQEIFKRDAIDRALANQRAGVSTLFGAPSFNAGISSLNLPTEQINPLFFQPFGVFGQGETLFNQLNNANNFALQREGLRLEPFLRAISPGLTLASQPGFAGSLGSLLGSTIPLLFLSSLNRGFGGNNTTANPPSQF